MKCTKWKSKSLSNYRKSCQGFTLLEVIIALGIVSVGILSVSRVITGYAETTATLEQRVVANWIAANRLETLRILASKPEPGSSRGSEEMAGRLWYFRENITTTADPSLFRIDIVVFTDREATEEAGNMFGYLRDTTYVPTLDSGALNRDILNFRIGNEA